MVKEVKHMTKGNEKGMVLVTCLFIIVALVLLGSIAVMTSSTDLKITGNYKTGIQAFYAAESGIAETRSRLRGGSANPITDNPNQTNTLWQAYIGTQSNAAAIGYSGGSVQSLAASLKPEFNYTVRIQHRLDPDNPSQVYYWGDVNNDGLAERNTTKGENIYLTTSYGASASGKRAIIAELAKFPPITVPGTLYGNVIAGGGNVSVDGRDNCTTAALPALAFVTSQTLYPSGSVQCFPEGQEAVKVPPLSLDQVVSNLQQTATGVLTGTQYSNLTLGSPTNYGVTYIDATAPQFSPSFQAKFQNLTGYGILVVKGSVYFSGNLNWNGLIVASGNTSFYGGGADVKNVYGAVLSNSTATIQGTVNLKYDSCQVSRATTNMPLKILSWKEDTGS